MNGSAIYFDASAFVKSFLIEAETPIVLRLLGTASRPVSSQLLETEARRAALRANPAKLSEVEDRLTGVALAPITMPILLSAGLLQPSGLRSLDAIHLATALELGPDLDYIVTYDERMAEGAKALGLEVRAPR